MPFSSDDLVRAKRLSELIQTEGYRAKIKETPDLSFVETGIGGYNVIVTLASPGTIQLYCAINRSDNTEIDLSLVNVFNREYRFAKIYIDNVGDIAAQCDLIFDLDSKDISTNLDFSFRLMETTINEMKKILQQARSTSAVT